MGQLPVLSKAWWSTRDFTATTLEAPMGSGPYKVSEVEPNRRIVLERVKDYWGAELGINRGRYNYDRIQYEYFADRTAVLEAFKGYVYDFRSENSSKDWATAYDFPAANKGDVITTLIPHSRPTGMQGFIFNLRRPVFQDPVVRKRSPMPSISNGRTRSVLRPVHPNREFLFQYRTGNARSAVGCGTGTLERCAARSGCRFHHRVQTTHHSRRLDPENLGAAALS